MFIGNPFKGAFGLDIGDLSIKLVRLTPRHDFHHRQYFLVDDIRQISLPPGYVVNGEIQQPEPLRKKIQRLLEKQSGRPAIKSPYVVVDLPEPKTFLKLIDVPVPIDQIMIEDVIAHARHHLPFNLEETYLDWQAITSLSSENNSKVLIGAAPKIIADSYTYLLESVGLQPIGLEVEALSIARALITDNKDYTGEARALLDLGATRSSLSVYDHGIIQFSTNLKFSGELLTTALSQQLKMEREEAEKIKIKHGLSYQTRSPRYLKIMLSLCDELVDEIKKALQFYYEHFGNANKITHITMCGGVSKLQKLSSLLARRLKISAEPGQAWKNLFNSRLPEQLKEKGALYTSAIGLALRAAQNPLEKK